MKNEEEGYQDTGVEEIVPIKNVGSQDILEITLHEIEIFKNT